MKTSTRLQSALPAAALSAASLGFFLWLWFADTHTHWTAAGIWSILDAAWLCAEIRARRTATRSPVSICLCGFFLFSALATCGIYTLTGAMV